MSSANSTSSSGCGGSPPTPPRAGWLDDAAVLGDLVLTHDMIAEGVHFLPSDPPASVGWKLVDGQSERPCRQGREPIAALMGLRWAATSDWDERFLDGVAAACETYGLALVGGDTIALPAGAPRVLGLTAIGKRRRAYPVAGRRHAGRRALAGRDARATPPRASLSCRPTKGRGPAGRGLSPPGAAARRRSPAGPARNSDDGRVRRPAARCHPAMPGQPMRRGDRPWSACPCRALSSPSGARIAARGCSRRPAGDDYALLAALPRDFDPLSLSLPSGTILARIGTLAEGEGLKLFDDAGEVPLPEHLGYEHRRD